MNCNPPVFLPTEEFIPVIANLSADWYEKLWHFATVEAHNGDSRNIYRIASACLWEDGITSSSFARPNEPSETRVVSRIKRPVIGLTVQATDDAIICLPPHGGARQHLFEVGSSNEILTAPTLAWLVPVQPGNVPYTKLMSIRDLLPMAYRLQDFDGIILGRR